MSDIQQHDTLMMFRSALDDLPSQVLPSSLKVRHMRSDEGAVWEKIASAAFPERMMSFDDMMRKDLVWMPERVLFLECEGIPVATASAWRVEANGPLCGHLHWVGVLPEYSGRGFGYVISLAAMLRMREEGCVSASLFTNDFRLPAIKTHLKLGYHICIDHPTLPALWAGILRQLSCH